jgi:hypothetical protein
MKRLLICVSYLLAAVLGAAIVRWHKPPAVDQGLHVAGCTAVIISEFGDPKLYRDKVCSDSDLARIYGEQRLREMNWIDQHDCDSEDTNVAIHRVKQ